MCGWWTRASWAKSRGACGLALFVACAGFVACGGSSKSKGAASTGGTGNAGTGGTGGSDTAGRGGSAGSAQSGSSSAVGGAASGSAGASGETAGGAGDGEGVAGAESSGGTGGSAAVAGAGGEGGSHAGESSGGSGHDCRDSCEAAPACCSDELRCVESAPSCRIDVLVEEVDVIYEYADLVTEIASLTGEVELSVPLTYVVRAAADPPPAARFEMTLGSEASIELAALLSMDRHPFRVSCDGEELFVGVVYMLEGAAAIRTPVLHVGEADGGALVLRLGALQGAWLFGDAVDVEYSQRIERTELRAGFCERGILDELTP
jgi:hypothetical protein